MCVGVLVACFHLPVRYCFIASDVGGWHGERTLLPFDTGDPHDHGRSQRRGSAQTSFVLSVGTARTDHPVLGL